MLLKFSFLFKKYTGISLFDWKTVYFAQTIEQS